MIRPVGFASAAVVLLLVACATPGPAPEPVRLRVMSWNVGDATGPLPSLAAIIDVLVEAGWQDVYLLQEVLGAQRAEALREAIALAAGGSYHLAYDRSLGTAILSRAPLEAPVAFAAPSSPTGRGAMLARAALAGGRAVTLVDVHFDPVPKRRDEAGRVDMGFGAAARAVLRETFTRTARSRSAAELLAWLDRAAASADGAPVVIAGDFNTVPSSAAVRLMSERYTDAAAASAAVTGRPLRGTYRRVRLPLRPRIDYVFVSPDLRVVEGRAFLRTAGDHFPVLATLELAP